MKNRTKRGSALKRRLWGSWLDPLGISHRTLTRAVERAREYARGSLLDIGCGTKPYYDLFVQRVSQYVGIEMPTASPNSTAADVCGNGLWLPFADRAFDTVLCNEVLEHVPEPVRLMREAARVLKPHGNLILTTPMTWGLHEEPRDYYRYTRYGLEYLAVQAGLHVERIEPTSGLWATVGQRASSHVYHSHGKNAFWLVKGIIVVICAAIQMICSALDRLDGHKGDTLDYLLIAHKTPVGD